VDMHHERKSLRALRRRCALTGQGQGQGAGRMGGLKRGQEEGAGGPFGGYSLAALRRSMWASQARGASRRTRRTPEADGYVSEAPACPLGPARDGAPDFRASGPGKIPRGSSAQPEFQAVEGGRHLSWVHAYPWYTKAVPSLHQHSGGLLGEWPRRIQRRPLAEQRVASPDWALTERWAASPQDVHRDLFLFEKGIWRCHLRHASY